MIHSHIIRVKRREAALSERELAGLLGISEARLCRLENHAERTRLKIAFGLQIVFDVDPRELFPCIYAEVEDEVMRRAARLDQALGVATKPASVRKRRLLVAMVKRSRSPKEVSSLRQAPRAQARRDIAASRVKLLSM